MAPSLLRDKAVSKYYGHYELDGNIGSAIPTAHASAHSLKTVTAEKAASDFNMKTFSCSLRLIGV